ncbi:MAG: hypothetical protein IJE77_04545 [Thermoguttaceae bacterium]|nr:hypothetical protein [Thermoguttaceae bacterium]
MKSFFRTLSSCFPFFANRPSALERAVRTSPKSRRLRMEPLENRALLAVDAFGVSASLAESNVEESWGPDPEPAAFSASVLATDAAVVDVSGVNATLADASFSVQSETPEPVAPPSFDQLMESLGMIEIESLDDESDAASASYLDEAASATQLLNSLNLQDVSQGTPRQVVFYDSSAADFDASTLNLDDESVYYVDAAESNGADAESYSVTPRSGGGSNSGGSSASGGSNSGGSSNSGGTTVNSPNYCHLTTYGLSAILESATFTGSGGSDQGPYFGFSTPSIPSGYSAYVHFDFADTIYEKAVYGQDYYIAAASIDENGVVTPNTSYVSGGQNSDGSYNLYVYGPATYCVVPRNDNLLESLEVFSATLYLVDMQSGGADYDPTPIPCDSFSVTIVDNPDDLDEYDYSLTVHASRPTREDPPEEDQNSGETTTFMFLSYYFLRDNPSVNDEMRLCDTGLADDYQRAMLSGVNLLNWEAMELKVQETLVAHILNNRNLTFPTYEERVARDVENYDGLYVYGDGYTDVVATSTATLVDEDVETDSLGLVESVKTYNVAVTYNCEVNDMFADPASLVENSNFLWPEFGTPYRLTGSFTITGNITVTVTTTRVKKDN